MNYYSPPHLPHRQSQERTRIHQDLKKTPYVLNTVIGYFLWKFPEKNHCAETNRAVRFCILNQNPPGPRSYRQRARVKGEVERAFRVDFRNRVLSLSIF